MSYIPNCKPIEGFEEILLKDGPIGAGDAMALYDLPETTQEAFAAGWNRRHDLAAMATPPKPSLSDELKAAVARLVKDVKSVLKGELAFTALAGNVGEVERLSDEKSPSPQTGGIPCITNLGYSLAGRISAAVTADELSEGCDISAGLYGPTFSTLVQQLAESELKATQAGASKIVINLQDGNINGISSDGPLTYTIVDSDVNGSAANIRTANALVEPECVLQIEEIIRTKNMNDAQVDVCSDAPVA